MSLRRLLEPCQVLEKGALEHSSHSTKYELQGSDHDLVHEHSSASSMKNHPPTTTPTNNNNTEISYLKNFGNFKLKIDTDYSLFSKIPDYGANLEISGTF